MSIVIQIDPAWEGAVQFYELVFGTWLSYIFLVFLWEKIFRIRLEEWRYMLLNFIGLGAFWVNHYFQYADFWMILLNLYTLSFLVAWYLVGTKPARKSWLWQLATMLGAIAYTVAFIGFENIARYGVDTLGYSEFWFMLASYIGFVAIILWRGKYGSASPAN
jgi:hypothetical protein